MAKTTTFESILAAHQHGAIITAVREAFPDLIERLEQLEHEVLGSITLADLIAEEPVETFRRPAKKTKKTAKKKAAKKKAKKASSEKTEGTLDLRSADGRATLDKAVLYAVQAANGDEKDGAKMGALEERIPFDVEKTQVRRSLNRLKEAGSVTSLGQGPGVLYYAV